MQHIKIQYVCKVTRDPRFLCVLMHKTTYFVRMFNFNVHTIPKQSCLCSVFFSKKDYVKVSHYRVYLFIVLLNIDHCSLTAEGKSLTGDVSG